MSATKQFSIGAILSNITGTLFCKFDEVQQLLDWVTDDTLWTHQLPRASRDAEPYLREWFPDLAAVVVPDREWTEESVTEWLATLGEQSREVPQMPGNDHESVDPLSELVGMIGADRVIPIVVDGAR